MEVVKNQFYLDLSNQGHWLIKQGVNRYSAGYDKEKAKNLIDRLNQANNPEVLQKTDNEIFVCWNNNPEHEKCDFICEIQEPWNVTPRLRWVNRQIATIHNSAVTEKVLQQMWQHSSGEQEWRDVETINL